MKKINVETLVPNTFKFVARDMDGKVFAFENKPNLATDIACDTWDVKEGKFIQLTNPVFLSEVEGITHSEVSSELGDWRDSLMEINDENLV
jgi:hypothetical protein|tara:strand:+ start:194 stop:466 length:273 start_codon:yes stop_codon:yes gene_type:complete